MALSRSVLAAVVAAVCVVLLACAPVAVAGCTQLLGVSHSEQTFTTAEMDQNNLVYLIGNYELPARVTSTAHYTSFDFKYTVPPQQEPHTVNYVRFAVFDFAESNSPVAQSELLTIRGGVRGNQTVTAHIQGTAGALKPSTPYRIAIWTEYPYVTFINSLAPDAAQYTVYNASQGFNSILEAGPYNPYQFPITYNGCK